ncbi:hypothetical protein DFQ28_006606 [Apophysomyces sp. BC1034]|nr:hypothetical protein DFQ30_003380 [Apophysomyces sp. BC1015]KAG0183008.1 hypothetical protein DFQ29_000819 [Apophysomyces sp. BC1021]KAG0194757.1 hypothetical protein DFQ28_006606 [Apophysomyces sp. BC1034]
MTAELKADRTFPNSSLHLRHRQGGGEMDEFQEAPSESTSDISAFSTRRRPNTFKDELKQVIDLLRNDELRQDQVDGNKDRFIDLAQAALEEATIEEDRKGVIQEVVEALIAKTGAPLVAEVISEQLRSQEVIERLAESHEEERQRMSASPVDVFAPNLLKEPNTEGVMEEDPKILHDSIQPILLVSEYMWRLFRVLLLASLVGLVYHFVRASPPSFLI